MDAWIDAEAKGSKFPDERLGKRFRKVMGKRTAKHTPTAIAGGHGDC